jgi:hypothetical protein
MIAVFLHDSQERLTLLAMSNNEGLGCGDEASDRHWCEQHALDWLQHNEPDSESQVVVARILETTEVGDFAMRGATPAELRWPDGPH